MSKKNGPYDQPGSLMNNTIKLLAGKDLIHVCVDTGISFFWLRKFVGGVFQNPSVNRVQHLFEYLTKKPLL